MNKYKEIRNSFKDYFNKLEHKKIESSSLIPSNDPSLLFTNSGMVQFKNVFLGLEQKDFNKAVTVQKCIRAGGKHNDLDNVGYTARHHTFFEMLGNFSFGDYFKEQTIEYAWNFLTKEIGLNKEKLYVTVYHTDEEAFNIWKKLTAFSDEKIIKISTNDNFWSMGDSGPCGPCSEIYYDYGDKIKGGKPGSENQDGDRFIEIWNLVFMQFNQEKSGEMYPLEKKCVDTGMGLERIVSVIEGKTDNYETSLFFELISNSRNILNNEFGNNIAHRVIADHLRSSSFLIADGILPSNEGRGYVLRRIMRRAMRYLYQINSEEALMHKLFPKLNELMSDEYPELKTHNDLIIKTTEGEEKSFRETLGRGIKILNDEVKNTKENIFNGSIAFKLYDTYGFPLDLTQDILRESKVFVNVDEFETEMNKQKIKSKTNWKGSGDVFENEKWLELAKKNSCEFIGYENDFYESKVIYIDNEYIVFDKTPFYPEGGGQTSDIGFVFESKDKKEIILQIIDVQKCAEKIIIHKYKNISNKKIKEGSCFYLEINSDLRNLKRINHSATHLLNVALRKTLGNHIMQRGSFVSEKELRFDFSHAKPLTKEELNQIEEIINFWIRESINLETIITSKKEAEKMGALATFGNKYAPTVRVVKFSDISIELCGGTHVKNTGNIGIFKILQESSIGSGIRRITAICGSVAFDYFSKTSKFYLDISDKLGLSIKDEDFDELEVFKKIDFILTENKKFLNELFDFKVSEIIKNNLTKLNFEKFNFYFVSTDKIETIKIKDFIFKSIDKLEKNSIIIGIFGNEKKSIAIGSSVESFSASKFIKFLTKEIDGKESGGGTDKFAMSGISISVSNSLIENLVKQYESN